MRVYKRARVPCFLWICMYNKCVYTANGRHWPSLPQPPTTTFRCVVLACSLAGAQRCRSTEWVSVSVSLSHTHSPHCCYGAFFSRSRSLWIRSLCSTMSRARRTLAFVPSTTVCMYVYGSVYVSPLWLVRSYSGPCSTDARVVFVTPTSVHIAHIFIGGSPPHSRATDGELLHGIVARVSHRGRWLGGQRPSKTKLTTNILTLLLFSIRSHYLVSAALRDIRSRCVATYVWARRVMLLKQGVLMVLWLLAYYSLCTTLLLSRMCIVRGVLALGPVTFVCASNVRNAIIVPRAMRT